MFKINRSKTIGFSAFFAFCVVTFFAVRLHSINLARISSLEAELAELKAERITTSRIMPALVSSAELLYPEMSDQELASRMVQSICAQVFCWPRSRYRYRMVRESKGLNFGFHWHDIEQRLYEKPIAPSRQFNCLMSNPTWFYCHPGNDPVILVKFLATGPYEAIELSPNNP
jgi:hypothetical protein